MPCRPPSVPMPPPSRRGVVLGLGAVALAGLASPILAPALAEGGVLAVTAKGDLPGFLPREVAPFLAIVMNTAGKNTPGGGQSFVAAVSMPEGPDGPASDRVEWTFRLNPYAAGASRSVGPPRSAGGRLFGTHRLMSVELRLYRGGRYQAQVFGQVEVQGGRRDADLQTFISDMTRRILDAAAQ
ncbi:hypothetical protein FBZ89_101453 [Nitrospirillum amazonense]|uniref:Uncharacterized protein n=1 Tax=Nitrospirillum amazonense TaxID=28077 RepID=A0A560FTB4_9PROT|nr:hypothetical protein [Nitrospirillum amazonense]TWB24827.1 hypothetical protein FBZ89_101453 [Nitrospirillum amazonense]